MARSLWICPPRAGPEAEQKQEDDQGGQADRKTDRRGAGGGRGEPRGGDVPSSALAHEPCCHTKGGFLSRWPQRRGKRERYVCSFPPSPFEQVFLHGEATLRSWEQYCNTHWYVA